MKKSKRDCIGCTENFYNGNNDLGVKECWSYANAKVVKKKFVHLDMRPPWNVKPERTLSCYHRARHVAMRPEVMR